MTIKQTSAQVILEVSNKTYVVNKRLTTKDVTVQIYTQGKLFKEVGSNPNNIIAIFI